jgi:hypothetical protein
MIINLNGEALHPPNRSSFLISTNMERAKSNTKVCYNTNEEPIVLSKHLLDILLKQNSPSDLIGLYTFYYYTAKWQETNQPWAVDDYCRKCLHWGDDRFKNAQQQLIKLGLIKRIRDTDEKGRVIKWFIKVLFIWKQEYIHQNPQNPKVEPEPSKPSSGFQETIALSSNNRIALSSNNSFLNAREEEKSPSKERNIIPPSLEMIKIYCSNKNSPIDPETFFNFYESKGWMIGKNKMVNWHSAVSTWEKKDKNESNYIPNRSYVNNKSKPKYAAAKTSKLRTDDIIINNITNEWKKTT